MNENEKKNRPQDDPATSSKSNEEDNDIISPEDEVVNGEQGFFSNFLKSYDGTIETALDSCIPLDGVTYESPSPDPIADVAAAHRYLRDIAERWNITVPDLLDYVGRLDYVARVMKKSARTDVTRSG